MKKTKQTTAALKMLRDQLPHGSYRTIAQKSGLAYFKIVNTFSGKVINNKVIEAALEVLEEIKEEEEKLASRIDALVG